MSIASLPYAESAVTSKKRHRGKRRNQGFSDCHGLHGRCAKAGAVGVDSRFRVEHNAGGHRATKVAYLAKTTVPFFAAKSNGALTTVVSSPISACISFSRSDKRGP
jgi:hypothetical protein